MKNKIKIVALSDLHGILPPSKNFPKCDLVLIGGDICGTHGVLDQSIWLHKEFTPWLENLPAEKIVAVAGNHDFIWEKAPHLVPKMPLTYLQDNECTYKGWKIYGSPWQIRFYNWAFNMDEPDLENRWKLIPDDADILLLHGPPKGFGDIVNRLYGKETDPHVGSPSLTKRIETIRPKLSIFGHIHSGFGVYDFNGSTLANVSIVNEEYKWTHQATEFVLDPEKKTTSATIKLIINEKTSKEVTRIIDWEASLK